MTVHPAKTQINLGILPGRCPGWSESSLGAHIILLVLSWGGSFNPEKSQNKLFHILLITMIIWAATWQNQQNECAPSQHSDQPGHPPSLIRVFAVRMKKAWVLSYPLSGQQRLWSDWADAQADLSLRWAHSHFVGFVMLRLKCAICFATCGGIFLLKRLFSLQNCNWRVS